MSTLEKTEDGFVVYNLYIGDIPNSFTEEILQKYFSRYGEVSSVQIRFCDDKTSRYAFINFKNATSATMALGTKLHYIEGTARNVVKKADSWWQPDFEDKLKIEIESDSLIMMLNDDCFIHIFSFLSTQERITLSHMNERFKQIFKITNIRNKPGLKIRLEKRNGALNYVTKYCYKLRSLNVANLRIGKYTKFRLLKNLTKISLRNCEITDHICFNLSKLQNLKYLDVSENYKLTGKHLKYFPELTHLNLYICCGIKRYHIFGLCSSNRIIENLKSLNIKNSCLSNYLPKLASLKNLESLVITSSIDFDLLSDIKKLKHLIIYYDEPTLSQDGQLTEKWSMNLETLFIIGENYSFTLTKTERNFIFSMKNIKRLGLIFCRNLDDEDITKIAAMPELTHLNITRCERITFNGFLCLLKTANKLQHVDISECSTFTLSYFPPYQVLAIDVLLKKLMEMERTTQCTLYIDGQMYFNKQFLTWFTIVHARSVFPGMKLRKKVCYEFED